MIGTHIATDDLTSMGSVDLSSQLPGKDLNQLEYNLSATTCSYFRIGLSINNPKTP